jgi:DNA-directed RNA polymerase subunit RPC12/RpoP
MEIRVGFTCTKLLKYMGSVTKQAIDSRSERDTRSKGALFCPNCSHQSQYDGDWIVVKSGQSSRYRCPDCRTEIMSRQSFEEPRSLLYPYTPWKMWGTNIRLLQKLFWM